MFNELHHGVSAHNVAALIIESTEADGVRLQKLLYFVQAVALSVYGRLAFPEPLQAYQWGPVVPTVWQTYQGQGSAAIVPPAASARPEVTSRVRAVIDLVVEELDGLSGFQMADKIKETPGNAWTAARGDLPPDAPSNRVLNTAIIRRTHLKSGLFLGLDAPVSAEAAAAKFRAVSRREPGALESLFQA